MVENSNLPQWDEYLPDHLFGKIFQKLPIKDILNVEIICKSWQRIVKGPYCWEEIVIDEEWSQFRQPEEIYRMLQMLITRSCGSHQKLCVTRLPSDTSFSLIANNGKFLKRLELPRGEITNSIREQVGMLSNLTYIDLSYCMNLGAPALEAIGKQCKFLIGLKRVMHPIQLNDQLSQDDEALVIAATMQKLKTLEIPYLVVGTDSIVEIISKCSQLELLDVRGCWQVNVEKSFLEKYERLALIGPTVIDPYENNSWDWETNSSDSGYLAFDLEIGSSDDENFDGLFADEQHDEQFEIVFHNDFPQDP